MTGDKSSRSRKTSAINSKGQTGNDNATSSNLAEVGDNNLVSILLTGNVPEIENQTQSTIDGTWKIIITNKINKQNKRKSK